MSKVIYACARNRSYGPSDEDRLHRICTVLEPDNIVSPTQHRIVANGNIAFAVMNYQPSVVERRNSLLLGCLFGESPDWVEPLAEFPDGSYALFRENEEFIELLADAAASRTVWYFLDDEQFVASTSQRALVMYLDSFEFDKRVIPWLLSTGTLGPELSWDQRFTRIPADSSVVLDRKSWSLSTRETPIQFMEKNRSDIEHREALNGAITETIQSLNGVNAEEWVLPLSGGYDSRAILCFSRKAGHNAGHLRTITWGMEESIHQAGNDARVAMDLAAALGVEHRYYHTDVSDEPVGKIIDRFLQCGEGRIDHLSGYMDGMRIWRDLLLDGVHGIIRGDEGFGWSPVSSALTVRYSVGCPLCSDFSNLVGVLEKYDLPAQDFPESLQQKQDSLSAWRDRLYHTYRLPTLLAALSEIKFSYVEQINPLLSRRILKKVRELPDRLRTDKSLFRQLVDAVSPDVPYADKEANSSPENILRKGPVVELVLDTLGSDYSRTLFSPEFLEFIMDGMVVEGPAGHKKSSPLKSRIKRLVPAAIKNFLRDSGVSSFRLDPNKLAFRVYIIIRMHKMMSRD
ncbi:MAG: hypothetical protein KOO60_03860 [Gemmatimonadales bacterium]|nr:hypothetical protein [Gemmatimonadales bacterium]